jgi:hypothetical protein
MNDKSGARPRFFFVKSFDTIILWLQKNAPFVKKTHETCVLIDKQHIFAPEKLKTPVVRS